jgi:hypothetical protein
MKRISLLIVAILALAGCSKLEVYEANIPGTWSESYDASKFAFDGTLRYTFDGGDTYTLYTTLTGAHSIQQLAITHFHPKAPTDRN